MISEFKKIFNYSFFQEISDSGLFGEWNKNKTIFSLHLSPELLSHNLNLKGGYSETYSDKLKYMSELGISKKITKKSRIGYKVGELEELLFDGNIINFDYLCDELCGIYDIEYNINKLFLLKKILYSEKQLEFYIKKKLLKDILFLYKKEQNEGNVEDNPILFDIDIILDELQIEEDILIINDFELLLYSISLCDNRKYVAKLLHYLMLHGTSKIKDILIKTLKDDKIFYYFTDEEVILHNEVDNMISKNDICDIPESTLKNFTACYMFGNIGVRHEDLNTKHINKTYEPLNIEYDTETKKLKYNGKISNFSGGEVQITFIEELYKNLNKPVPIDRFKELGLKDAKETLKNIREKLETEKGINKFTGLEARTLISDFTYKKIKYFILHS